MEQNKVNVSVGDSKLITINDREILVKKLGLIKYTIMTKSVKDLIATSIDLARKLIADEDLLELDENVPVAERASKITDTLINMLETNILQVIKLIDICVPDLGYEYICEQVGINDAVLIIKTIVEVNKLQQFGEEIKNLLRGLQINK